MEPITVSHLFDAKIYDHLTVKGKRIVLNESLFSDGMRTAWSQVENELTEGIQGFVLFLVGNNGKWTLYSNISHGNSSSIIWNLYCHSTGRDDSKPIEMIMIHHPTYYQLVDDDPRVCHLCKHQKPKPKPEETCDKLDWVRCENNINNISKRRQRQFSFL